MNISKGVYYRIRRKGDDKRGGEEWMIEGRGRVKEDRVTERGRGRGVVDRKGEWNKRDIAEELRENRRGHMGLNDRGGREKTYMRDR